jgi:CheY-like chemotaxis protein
MLLDCELSGSKGTDLARELRRRPGGDRPVIIAITAQDSDEMRQRCRAAGMDEFALKPLHLATLRSLLNAVRERRGLPPLVEPAASAGALALDALQPSVLAAFPTELDAELAALAAAAEAETAARIAHRLCGLGGLVQAREFCAAAEQVTRSARSQPSGDWRADARKLAAAAEALKRRLLAHSARA